MSLVHAQLLATEDEMPLNVRFKKTELVLLHQDIALHELIFTEERPLVAVTPADDICNLRFTIFAREVLALLHR